jgi:hypothetical protein
LADHVGVRPHERLPGARRATRTVAAIPGIASFRGHVATRIGRNITISGAMN